MSDILTPGTRAFSTFKWIGTGTGVAGALILALNIPISGWGWVLFGVSSGIWSAVALKTHDHSLAVLQGVFFVVDIIGVWRWLIV
jgi:hypothetical protein